MRSLTVVILDPGSDLDPGMGKAHEQRLIEKLIAHAAVEALDVAVLHRLARSDVMPLHADLAAPRQDGIAGELGAIVAHDHAQLAAMGDEPGQLAHPRCPEIEVSGTAARHSRVTSSTTLSTRNRLPSAIWS